MISHTEPLFSVLKRLTGEEKRTDEQVEHETEQITFILNIPEY